MGLTGIWLGQTVGPLAVRLGFNPTACTGFLKPIFFGRMDILLTLDTGEGPWSCIKVMYQTLLTSREKAYRLWILDGTFGWVEIGGGRAEETEGVVLVYKIRKDCFKIVNKLSCYSLAWDLCLAYSVLFWSSACRQWTNQVQILVILKQFKAFSYNLLSQLCTSELRLYFLASLSAPSKLTCFVLNMLQHRNASLPLSCQFKAQYSALISSNQMTMENKSEFK